MTCGSRRCGEGVGSRIRWIRGPDPALFVNTGGRDLAYAAQIGQVGLRIVGEVEAQSSSAVLARKVGQGGQLRYQVAAEREQFMDYERRAGQQQRDATGEHDNRSQLALNRYLFETRH